MRLSASALSAPLLALLAGALVLAGCDSGSDPSDDLGQNTAFSFANAGGSTVAEDAGDTYELTVVVTDPGFQELSVEVVFDEGASSVDFSELSGIERTTTLTFPQSATDSTSQTLTFQVEDDDEIGEMGEDVVFTLQNPQNGSVGANASYTLTVNDDDLTAIPIADALAMTDGETVAVEGVVTRLEGSNVRIQDDTGGIVVRSGDLADALAGGDVSIGDRIRALGPLGAYNGLRQLSGDSVEYMVVEEDAGLPDAQPVSLSDIAANGEAFESELVRIEGLSFVDASGTFEGSTNYTVTDGEGNELALRIPGGSFYEGESIPSGTFTFTGVLGQFSESGEGGYQLLATREGDIIETGGGEPQVILAEDFQDEEGLGAFTQFSVASDTANWTRATFDDENFYAYINGFNDSEASNDWLITDEALALENFENEVLTFENVKRYGSEDIDLKLKYSTDYDGEGDPTNFTWTDISGRVTFDDASGDYTFQPAGPVDLSDLPGQVYIAFHYTEADAALWELDNILIEEQGASEGEGFPAPPSRPSN